MRIVRECPALGIAFGNIRNRESEVIVAACRGRSRRVVTCCGRVVEHKDMVAGVEKRDYLSPYPPASLTP